jgi:preprotein translocase SecE subunit
MAVAVKNTPETTSRQPLDRLAFGSLVGAIIVLGGLGVVFPLLGNLWATYVSHTLKANLGAFVDTALLLLVRVAALVGLVLGARYVVGRNPPPGLRAGVFTGVVGILGSAWLACLFGSFLQSNWPGLEAIGLGITAGIGVCLLIVLVRAFFRPGFRKGLVQFEEQGWFTAAAYKRTQGQRVRRGTILALLIVAGCGIYTLLGHKTLEFGLPDNNHLQLVVPFTGGLAVTLLPDLRFTVPLLLAAAALWLAYRVVNYPAFADFLIATEAEVNKVSWSSRKRLYQDTVVVLTTVILMTLFLLVVDVAWGWLLSNPYVGVLKVPQNTDLQQKSQTIDW